MPTPVEILDLVDTQNGEPPRSLSQQAYQHIRRKIISLELAPGAVIDDNALREDLDMGRTPIREALQRLALEKLIKILPRRGMFVAEIGLTDLQRLFEVRYVLEGLAAELAAQRGTDDQFARMAAVLAYLPEGESTDAERLIAIDEAFHSLIYEATDNKFIRDTLVTLYAQSLRLWYFTLSQIGTLQDAVREHQSILVALQERDGETASRLLQEHVQIFHKKIQTVMIGAPTSN